MEKGSRRTIRFIVNPISGSGRKQRVESIIPKYFDEEQWDVAVLHTERAGHAEDLAREAASCEADIVVAVGGDGTVNEVARAITGSQTALGIIPCGSGNGLARHLGVPMGVEGAMKLLASPTIKALDYGLINDHPFFCTCGVGFDAFVSERFSHSDKRGLMTYVENTFIDGLQYKPETYEVHIGGESHTYEAFLITCGNASQYGNNVYIAPDASMRDGLLDVIIMEPFPIAEAGHVVLQLLSKQITRNSHTKAFRCEEMTIHRQKEGVVHFDGDPILCGRELTIRVVKQGILMVTNPDKHRRQLALPVTLKLPDLFTNLLAELPIAPHRQRR